MRRSAALAGLSREHHRELVHARHLLRAAEDGPEQRLKVAAAYVEAFLGETVAHFRREEEVLFPAYARRAGSTPVLERILQEHMQLHGLVRTLQAGVAAGDVEPEALHALGRLLREHVRVEERELFEEIQRALAAAELAALDLG